MFQRRPITGFFVRLLLIYGFLIAPWPFTNCAYMACFRVAGNLLFNSVGPAGSVRFEGQSPPDDKWATRLTFRNRASGAEGSLERCNARHGYLMLSLTAALIAATPISWSRRWKSLLLGLFLANVILELTVWLTLLGVFSDGGPLAQFTPSPFGKSVLTLAVRILALSPEVPFVMPVFIWLLVTIRRCDLQQWLGADTGGEGGRSRQKNP
jgi:hypothetical protein